MVSFLPYSLLAVALLGAMVPISAAVPATDRGVDTSSTPLGLMYLPTDMSPPTDVSSPTDVVNLCVDNPEFHLKKKRKTCEWISRRNYKQKNRYCRKGKVQANCPETCDIVCDDGSGRVAPQLLTTCPRDLHIKKYQAGRGATLDCSEYQEGLQCFSDHRYTGCRADVLQCKPWQSYVCTNNNWKLDFLDPEWCTVDAPRDGAVLFGTTCDPYACPSTPPNPGSDCSAYKGKYECNYNYKTIGCEKGDEKCVPIQHYSCSESYGNTWQMYSKAMAMCPNGNFQGVSSCDPTTCPANEPTDGADCSHYQGIADCSYDYRATGCGADNMECTPTKDYTCTAENQFKWKANARIFPACWTNFSVGSGEPCNPDACPLSKPSVGSDCSTYKGGRVDCRYNYQYEGCTFDSLQCTAMDYFTCDDVEDTTWQLAKYAPPSCDLKVSAPVNNFDFEDLPKKPPVGQSCEACPTVEPAGLCPSVQPRAGDNCTVRGYAAGLNCSYNFQYHGCTVDELECKPFAFYECNEAHGWMVSIADPLPCSHTV